MRRRICSLLFDVVVLVCYGYGRIKVLVLVCGEVFLVPVTLTVELRRNPNSVVAVGAIGLSRNLMWVLYPAGLLS